MCDPLTMAIGSFAIGAVQTASSFMSASAQADQQNRLYEQNRLNSIQAFQDTQAAVSNRQSQELEAAAAAREDNAIEARKARATNRVAAGESGITGVTVDSLLRDIYQQENRTAANIDQNTDWTMQQLQAEKKSQGYTAVDRINSVQKAAKPSFLDAGLKLATTGLNAASSYKTLKK